MSSDAEENPRSKRAPPASSKAASRANPTTAIDLPKSIDDKYDVVSLLGKGGMGAVYEATNRQTGRRVAIKVIVNEALAKEPEILSRFRREARASGTVDSQHVVQVLDTGVDGATNSPYMVMEHLAGEDLSNLIHRLGPLPPQLVVNIAAQACLGLERAHAAGIIHRDIKSANIFLARGDGGNVTIKVLDFGIAKVRADPLAPHATSHHLTRTGTMLGSPLYMSPEQARGMKTLDGRADLWSLGVVMYEALTGNPPNAHCESLGELLLGICSEDAKPVEEKAPWVSSGLAAIVRKALTREAAERYASAEQMHAALSELAPRGISIHDSMIAALPAEMKSAAATHSSIPVTSSKASTTPISLSPPQSIPKGGTLSSEPVPAELASSSTPPPTGQTGPSLVSAAASTMSGVGQSTDPQAEAFRSSAPSSTARPSASSSSKAFIAAGVVATLLFASVGTIVVVKTRKPTTAAAQQDTTALSATPSASASMATAPAPSPSPAPSPLPTPVPSPTVTGTVAEVADASVTPTTTTTTTTAGKPLPKVQTAWTAPTKPATSAATTTKTAEPSEPAIQRNF
jgi:eukaryotic-like serine/threonine-protein kinase